MTGLSASLARCALIVALSSLLMTGCGKKAPPPSPPPEALVTEAQREDVPIYDDFVGTLEPSVNASIQARVQGYLVSQNYAEGRPVKKGDLLFQIDPLPFESALAQAKAALAQAEAMRSNGVHRRSHQGEFHGARSTLCRLHSTLGG